MSVFKNGDRVRHRNGWTGTVIDTSYSPGIVKVKRDDGVTGSDLTGWNAAANNLSLLEETPLAPPAGMEVTNGQGQEHKHVMGLDKEEFDWAAHKAFGRGM